MSKFDIDKETLEELYISKVMTFKEIAKLYSTSKASVGRKIKKYNIDTRNKNYKKIKVDIETIKELYEEKGISINCIASQLNLGKRIIERGMKEHGIKTRSRKESNRLSYIRKVNSNERKGSWILSTGYVAVATSLLSPKEKEMFESMFHDYIIPEHRLLIARKLNRPLTHSEEVHHINGVRHDNRDENLLLMTGRQHRTLIPAIQRRIKELEDQISMLQK